MSKTLVAYFSASGTTSEIAKEVSELTGGDLFEIKPVVPYTKEDLDWTNKNSRTSIEMQDEKSRPKIAEKLSNMADYDTVFLGFPIWWYVAPTIINNFLESYDFSGKTIRPFFTSGGSGAGQTDERLHESAPKAIWRPAKRLYANNTERTNNWINDIE
jgi:flavodoxin